MSGDARVSVYVLNKLQAAGLVDHKTPMDSLAELGKKDKKYVKAGKEKGFLFGFMFHTAFVDTKSGAMNIAVKMMDGAVKNKKMAGMKKPYTKRGVAKLTFASS